MKSSKPESSSGRNLAQRFQALIHPAKKKKTHRLSANVTGEDDWEVDEPQIRMSRAFAVMLILHLVAVGGLFAFHMFGKDDREAEGIATRSAHQTSPPPPAVPVKPAIAAAPVIPAAPRAEIVSGDPPAMAATAPNGRQHVFKAGETKMLIAAKFGITVRELEEANAALEFKAGDTLTIPQHQRVIGALADNTGPANPPIALIVATPSEDVGHREFAIKEGADNPYAPVEPAEIAAVTAEAPAPRVKTVKAEPEVTAVHESDEVDEPESRPAPKVKKPAPAAVPVVKTKPATGSRTHVIRKGDTVYNVAKRYGLSPNEVMRANGITDASRVQMGQVLKITVKR